MTNKSTPEVDQPGTFLLNSKMKQEALYHSMLMFTRAAGHFEDETERGAQLTICNAVRHAIVQGQVSENGIRSFYEVCRLMLKMPESKVIAPKPKPNQAPLKRAALLGWQVVK